MGIMFGKKKEKENRKKRFPIKEKLDKFRSFLIQKCGPLVRMIKYMGQHSITCCIIWSFIMCILIETFGRHSLIQAFIFIGQHPLRYLFNSAILFAPFTLVFLFRKRIIGYMVFSALWLGMGITNGIVLSKRVTPFTYVDIKLADAAMAIFDNYMKPWQIILIIVGILLVIAFIAIVIYFVPKRKEKINYKKTIISLAVFWTIFLGSMYGVIKAGIFSTVFGNIAYAYNDYGVVYCFSITAIRHGITTPVDYSNDHMTALISEINSEASKKEKTKDDPNIIFLQLESFMDLNRVKKYTFSENPTPYFDELKKKYSSGYLKVPSVGAGTANTEFECITGMRLAYFGPGEYPYKTILKKTTCESMAYDLKNLGYATHAIHNNTAKFYGRNTVFANLGFDNYTSIETMNFQEKTPIGWCKDKYLIQAIEDNLNSTLWSDYIYAISVQGHGDYYNEKAVVTNPQITVEGCESPEQEKAVTYYAQQINEMDQFIKDLTTMLSKRKEKTVLVLYGDHLPGLGFTDDDLTDGNTFYSEYVIWDNYGLKKEDKKTTSYRLGATVLDHVGIHTGTIFNYHQQWENKKGYSDNLKGLQYDMLYGKQYIYGGTNPFKRTNMRFGVHEISMRDVIDFGDYFLLNGKNFTKYCDVYINGEEVPTSYIASNMLKVKGVELQPGDKISVRIVNSSDEIYQQTPEYEWKEDGTVTKAVGEE